MLASAKIRSERPRPNAGTSQDSSCLLGCCLAAEEDDCRRNQKKLNTQQPHSLTPHPRCPKTWYGCSSLCTRQGARSSRSHTPRLPRCFPQDARIPDARFQRVQREVLALLRLAHSSCFSRQLWVGGQWKALHPRIDAKRHCCRKMVKWFPSRETRCTLIRSNDFTFKKVRHARFALRHDMVRGA